MSVTRRILVSAPRDIWLDPHRIEIKQAIVDEITRLGYEPKIFLGPTGEVGLAAGAGWDLEEVERVAKRCVGAVIIGLPFWKTTQEGREVWLPTDYCQYEGAVAHSYGLPVLAIAIGIEQRVVFDQHARLHAVSIPLQQDRSWFDADAFRRLFEGWKHEIEHRRDVFLGYCSKSAGTAALIQLRLERLGASVLNYVMDFRAGTSILNEIESAHVGCSCSARMIHLKETMELPRREVTSCSRPGIL